MVFIKIENVEGRHSRRRGNSSIRCQPEGGIGIQGKIFDQLLHGLHRRVDDGDLQAEEIRNSPRFD
jgi:hypothetical protein